MCGRYVSIASTENLYAQFDLDMVVGADLAPSWNVAPTDPVRMVVERAAHPSDGGTATGTIGMTDESAGPHRQLRTARWGLVPSWSRDAKGGARMINARIETVTVKPAFKAAAAKRRCLLPAQGYYEWQTTATGKVAYFLTDPDAPTVTMAGLYELWRDPARGEDDPARWLWSCTVITQQASDLIGMIHDRSPVIVPPALRSAWLDPSVTDLEAVDRLLGGIAPAHLAPRIVSPAVGNVANNGPELIEAIAPAREPAQEQLPL